jgi:hypothetical protein
MFHCRDHTFGKDWEWLFWTRVPCLFNMEKSSSLWDIPCGSLPESKNRELMSFGVSNLEAQNPPGPEFG